MTRAQHERGGPEFGETRTLLDQLLADSRLYSSSTSYKELLEFAIRLRNFAPFNAMLLNLQKPGLTYAASAYDWRTRFNRYPKEDARPLIILWPFGPVATVYDIQDTEGKPLPEDVASFFTVGEITAQQMEEFKLRLAGKGIAWRDIDVGGSIAGKIECLNPSENKRRYELRINANHDAPTRFATLAHELGHLFLGHLGEDRKRKIPQRRPLSENEQELEAESVAYLVCRRNKVTPKSERYLAKFISANTSADQLDVYQIMRAAGQVETILGLIMHTHYE